MVDFNKTKSPDIVKLIRENRQPETLTLDKLAQGYSGKLGRAAEVVSIVRTLVC